MKLTESQKIYKNLIESLDYYNSIVDDVVSGKDVYVKLNGEDAICLVRRAEFPMEPGEYDEGYFLGWDRGEDPQYDKEQDERYEEAKRNYEEGNVFETVALDENNEPSSETIMYSYGEEELKADLQAENAKRVNQKTVFEDEEEEE